MRLTSKAKIGKGDYVKPKVFCTANKMINRIKRKPLSLVHQRADRRSKKKYSPTACKTKTAIIES